MLLPVAQVNPTQLCSSSSEASTILNNGPGNLYVYGSSAVSINGAYDSIIGAGGTMQWSGGSLWGVADTAGQTVNVMVGASNVNTGSTSISGTVSTVATSTTTTTTSTAPVWQTEISGTLNSNSTNVITIPSTFQAGDWLYIAASVSNTSGSASISSGWSGGGEMSGQTKLWYKKAVSNDPGGTVSITMSSQSGYYVMGACRGTQGLLFQLATITNQSITAMDCGVRTINQAVMLLTDSSRTWSFGTPAPPTPAPTLSNETFSDASTHSVGVSTFVTNWTNAQDATFIMSSSGAYAKGYLIY